MARATLWHAVMGKLKGLSNRISEDAQMRLRRTLLDRIPRPTATEVADAHKETIAELRWIAGQTKERSAISAHSDNVA